MTVVFVYGTLKRAKENHHFLEGQRFVGDARTQPAYRLFSVSTYPGLVEASGGLSIEGELWEVDDACLRHLDELEGLSEGLYRRGPIALQPPWDNLGAVAYYYERSLGNSPDLGTRFD